MMILKLKSLVESKPLFKEAFTHASANKPRNFERLEFLGDSLIGAYITKSLYTLYPKASEGELSRWRSAIISQETMAEIAMKHNISEFLASSNKDLKSNKRIMASLVESYLGAVYLEFGESKFKEEAEGLFKSYVENAKALFTKQDPKTILQEKIQEKLKITPTYKLIGDQTMNEDLAFRVGLFFAGEKVAEGIGSSIKSAEKMAAKTYMKNNSESTKTKKEKFNTGVS